MRELTRLVRRVAAVGAFLVAASMTPAVASASPAPALADAAAAPPTRTCDIRATWPSALPGNPPSGWYYCDYGITFTRHEGAWYVAVVGGDNYSVWYTRHRGSGWISWQNLGGVARSSVLFLTDDEDERLAAGVRGTDGRNWCILVEPRVNGWRRCG